MSEAIDNLFNSVCDLLEVDNITDSLAEPTVKQTMDDRIAILEAYAMTIIDSPKFDIKEDYIRLRRIRLFDKGTTQTVRIHSLLVDVIKKGRRYTAGIARRISTGER